MGVSGSRRPDIGRLAMLRRWIDFVKHNKLKTVAVAIPVAALLTVAGWNGSMKAFHDYPQLCATCHVIRPYYETWAGAADFGDYRHTLKGRAVPESTVEGWGEKDVVCKDCHYSSPIRIMEEFTAYVTGNYTIPLKERRLSTTGCLACHVDYAKLIERTEGYVINAQEINPHAFKVNLQAPFEPHSTEKGELDCYQCHKMHKAEPALQYCYQCHHGGTFQDCGDCHEGR